MIDVGYGLSRSGLYADLPDQMCHMRQAKSQCSLYTVYAMRSAAVTEQTRYTSYDNYSRL